MIKELKAGEILKALKKESLQYAEGDTLHIAKLKPDNKGIKDILILSDLEDKESYIFEKVKSFFSESEIGKIFKIFTV